MMRRHAALWSVLAVTAAVYARTLGYWFLWWDDNGYVFQNPVITSLGWRHWQAIWGVAYQNNYAPVPLLSYALDWHLFGMQAAGYHAVNVLWHLLNVWLVYRLLRAVGLGAVAAWWGSACFALHPVQVETVVWIAERKNLLATAGTVMAVLAYAHTTDDHPARRTWRLVSLLAGALAVLAKASAIILPVLCIAQDRWVSPHLRGRPPAGSDNVAPARGAGRTQVGGWRESLRRSAPFWILGLAGGVLAVWASRVDAFPAPWHGGSLWATLWTLPRVWVAYLRLIVWPRGLSLWYDIDETAHWMDGRALVALAVLGALAWALWRWQRRQPRVAWWAWWTVAALVPTANLVPLLPWMHDRYLYLPMVGVCGLLSEGLAAAWGRQRWLAAGCGVVVLAALSIGTARRVAVWRDPVTLWSDAVRHAPQSALPRVLLGDALVMAGRSDEAQRMHWSAADADPDSRLAWEVRGLLLERQGDRRGAQAAYVRANALTPGGLQVLMATGDVAYERADWSSALDAYAAVVARRPFTPAVIRLAAIAQQLGQRDQAVYWYRRALRQQPWRADLHERLADALAARGQTADAARARAFAEAWRQDDRRLALAHRRAAAQYRRWGWSAQAVQAEVAAQEIETARPIGGSS